MSVVISRKSFASRALAPLLSGTDWALWIAIALLAGLGVLAMSSVGLNGGTRVAQHGRNLGLALCALLIVAQIPPRRLMQLALPVYLIGVSLLVATALFGITKKGSTRWLNVGVVIQPSEMMKLATPLMLASWFHWRSQWDRLSGLDFLVGFMILALPLGLVAKQPDLGTGLLIASSGFYVIFFAGLRWRWILPVGLVGLIAIVGLVLNEERLCQAGVDWRILHDYQKHRVCTLLNPMTDPLGKGFHTLQGMIAIGSGGVWGKGLGQGSQTQLDFVPESTTDFVFAAFAEELGLLGACGLILGFILLISRALAIGWRAPSQFSRLLAGAIGMSVFTYAFVNIGMVSGVLPVVGIPLPFISYGGTAMVTLGVSLGMLMSIAKSARKARELGSQELRDITSLQ